MPRNRRRGNPIARIGVFLVIIGFGSVVLHSATDYQFTVLAWADGMQPYIGLVVGLIGAGLLATPLILRARQGSPDTPVAPGAAFAQPQPANQFPQPQPTTFAQPQPSAPGGFPAPQPGFPQPTNWETQPPAQQQFGQQFPQNGRPQQ